MDQVRKMVKNASSEMLQKMLEENAGDMSVPALAVSAIIESELIARGVIEDDFDWEV